MRRRGFITLLCTTAGMLCLLLSRAQSQSSKTYRIGYLALAKIPHLIEALQDGLRKFGYVEGDNLKTEYRFLQGGSATLDALAAELVRLSPDLIVTVGTPPALAAKRATTTIPIVMATVGDPAGLGIVASLGHPGGNVTGVTLYSSELSGKRVEVLKQAVPGIARVAVLGNGSSPLTQLLWQQTQMAAQLARLDARLFTVQEPNELSAAFETMVQDGANGVVILSDSVFNSVRRTIIALATTHRLPAVYEAREYVVDGGLISYGPNIAEMSRRSAAVVNKVLKGAKPADVPIEQPTEFELVINLKTAKALDLIVPHNLLVLADEVIE
jgi:putative tryptophan/tyrosine transport system substrate-binding protein